MRAFVHVSLALLLAGFTSALSDSERHVVLKLHNVYRSRLAKGKAMNKDGSRLQSAENMHLLTYSTDLERIAQKWADRCIFKHSENGNGENLYALLNGDPKDKTKMLRNAPKMWWSELKEFGLKQLTLTRKLAKSGVGHFTQMAWAATTQIGCGVAVCPRASKPMNFVVCQYNTGNVLTMDIYKPGKPCSTCTCDSRSKLCK